jgi:RNA polymerase sigma-70 factor (ECF subfamily)
MAVRGDPTDTGPDDELEALRSDLFRAVGRVCPPWLSDRREDLVQEALIRVAEIRRREPERELQPAYLRRAAYNALVDEIRRLRRRRETSLEGDDGTIQPPSEAPGPERLSAGRELGRAIQDCLGRLVPPRRRAVALHLQGHSGPESARLMGWTPKRTNNLVYRGLDDLRRCLGGKGYSA